MINGVLLGELNGVLDSASFLKTDWANVRVFNDSSGLLLVSGRLSLRLTGSDWMLHSFLAVIYAELSSNVL